MIQSIKDQYKSPNILIHVWMGMSILNLILVDTVSGFGGWLSCCLALGLQYFKE